MKLMRLFKQDFALPALLGVTEEAEEWRNGLAMAAVKVAAVRNPSDQDAAMAAARDIQDYCKSVQETGLDFRRPVSAFLALVKRTEDDHLAPILAEKARVESLVLGFQQREKQRVADEERRRNEEFQRREQARIAEERRLEDERKAKQAEADRIQAARNEKLRREKEKADALLVEAKNKKQREAAAAVRQEALRKQALAEVERQKRETALRGQQEKDAAKVEADRQANYDLLRQPLPQAAKASGASVKRRMEFEVVSAAEVYKHRPELVKLEVKASAVNSVVFARESANVADKDETTVPGLRLWWSDSISTARRSVGAQGRLAEQLQ